MTKKLTETEKLARKKARAKAKEKATALKAKAKAKEKAVALKAKAKEKAAKDKAKAKAKAIEKKAKAQARKAAKPVVVDHLFGRHMLKAHLVGEDKHEHKKILDTFQKRYDKTKAKALLLKDKIVGYKESVALWKGKVNSTTFNNLKTSTQESLKKRLAKAEQTLTKAEAEYTSLEKTLFEIGLDGKKLIGETETSYIKKTYLGRNYAKIEEYRTPKSYDDVVPEGTMLTVILEVENEEYEYSGHVDAEDSKPFYVQTFGDGTKTVMELINDYIEIYGKTYSVDKFGVKTARYLTEKSILITDKLRAKTEKKSPREKRLQAKAKAKAKAKVKNTKEKQP